MQQLIRELQAVLDDIDQQIDEMARDATQRGTGVFHLRYVSGEYAVAPLLVAKANILVAIVNLKKEIE